MKNKVNVKIENFKAQILNTLNVCWQKRHRYQPVLYLSTKVYKECYHIIYFQTQHGCKLQSCY